MDDVKLKLNDFLKDCSKLLILGIGNDIRGDDGLGPYIINQLYDLKECLLENDDCSETNLYEFIDLDKLNNLKNSTNFKNLVLINAGSVPENFTGTIKKENPSHILIIDASLTGKNPGDMSVVLKENIVNLSVSTHSMSLSYLIKYLETDSEFNILFIGIEPKVMDLSFDLSDSVKNASDNLINIILESILNI